MEDFMVIYIRDGHRKAELFTHMDNVCKYCKMLRDFGYSYKIYVLSKNGTPQFLEGWNYKI